MTARHFGMTSRTATTGINPPSGSRDARTKYNPRTEIIRMPSGSIAQVPSFESRDLPHAGFNKPLLFGLAVNFLAWGFLVLAGRALASVFL